MKPAICEQFGIDFPLFAFSHCRDVVAAVTNAGGFGVLGAVAHTPEQLEIDLAWIEAEVKGKPYGLDLLLPQKYAGADEGGLDRDAVRRSEEHTSNSSHTVISYAVFCLRSEERRVGKECRSRWSPYH